MDIRINVVDAGARYGLHPTWSGVSDLAHFFLFEIDKSEVARLKAKYQGSSNVTVFPYGIGSRNETIQFNIARHKGLNSLLKINEDCVEEHAFMAAEMTHIGTDSAEIVTLDSFLKNDIHFMKLDIEGAELDGLKGATRHLETVLGIRAEVVFMELFKEQPLFGALHEFLLMHDFELLNLDYDGRGHSRSKFTMPGRYGRLMGTDAVWTKKLRCIYDSADPVENILRYTLFLMQNNASDIAIQTLQDAVNHKGLSFEPYKESSLFLCLGNMVQILFKSLSSLPYHCGDELAATYKTIFGKELLTMNNFYENIV